MNILGIETSCDETSVAIVEDGRHVHSCVIASQIKAHRRHGGVVPELASRMHTESLPRVLHRAFKDAGFGWEKIDGIAVTHRPGLESSLLIGVTAAKTLAHTLSLPLYGINHLHGHIISPSLSHDIPFPHLSLVVSGGHTQIWHVRSFTDMSVVAQTRDDAVGEAFDKVARLVGLGYPGGPLVEQTAKDATSPVVFPVPLRHDPTSFSFSGLKTAVMLEMGGYQKSSAVSSEQKTPEEIANVCHGFQKAVVQHLLDKIGYAIAKFEPKALTITGGVAANQFIVASLRQAIETGDFHSGALREPPMRDIFRKILPFPVYTPEMSFCTDNAAMIAAAAYHMQSETLVTDYTKLEVLPTGC
jgi:N6-L-threonylcarbamoyladenine synthase